MKEDVCVMYQECSLRVIKVADILYSVIRQLHFCKKCCEQQYSKEEN